MDVAKKDNLIKTISSQIAGNKKFLNTHYKELETLENSNPYLENIKKDYKCIHDNCLQEKKTQIQHMDNLVKYLNFHKSNHPELKHDIKKIIEIKNNIIT